jgi:hypothetical protein
MAAYTEVAAVNQVAIYYGSDANSADCTTLITTLSNHHDELAFRVGLPFPVVARLGLAATR